MTTSEMTKGNHQKHEKTDVKMHIRKQKNSAKVIILGFILMFGLVIYFVIAYKGIWLDSINRLDPFSHNKNKTQELASKESDKVLSNEAELIGCFPDNTETLLKFAPSEEELDSLNDSEDFNPYDKYIEETDYNSQAISSVNLINGLNDYRIYLLNVNEFLRKFAKNQIYSENLDVITQIRLPKKFDQMLEMCKSYDSMLVKNAPSHEQILLFNTDIFSKFLKIRKETDSFKEMKKLKTEIENNIDLFITYMFSVELQEEFLK